MLGDFNIDQHDMNSNTMDFLQLCMSLNLFSTINICTRVGALTSKLLDNIFSNSNFSDPGVIVTDISDHFELSWSSKLCIPWKQGCRFEMSMFPVLNQNNKILNKRLQILIGIHFVENPDDINISFQRFYGPLNSVFIKTCIEDWTWSKKKVPKKPSLSSSLIWCINMKGKLYNIQYEMKMIQFAQEFIKITEIFFTNS